MNPWAMIDNPTPKSQSINVQDYSPWAQMSPSEAQPKPPEPMQKYPGFYEMFLKKQAQPEPVMQPYTQFNNQLPQTTNPWDF